MSTYKQRMANRANAKKSTGPKSAKGKSVSRKNAYKHGLAAKQIIVPGETPEQFEKLREGLIAGFAPGTTIEFELIDQLAALFLRQRRMPVVEAAMIKTLMRPSLDSALKSLTEEELDQLERINRKMFDSRGIDVSEMVERQREEGNRETAIPRRVEMLNVFARYETHIMNEIVKTVRLIRFLQESRVGA